MSETVPLIANVSPVAPYGCGVMLEAKCRPPFDSELQGLIPEHLMRPEVAHQNLDELLVVGSMHERKRTMAERADAFIVLPGGYGTFEEMFEMVTWLQLRLQAKPVGMLNVEGYFDHLLAFLRHGAAEGFIRAEHRDLLLVDDSVERLLDGIARRALVGGAAADLERT